jgi:hypothetical protein
MRLTGRHYVGVDLRISLPFSNGRLYAPGYPYRTSKALCVPRQHGKVSPVVALQPPPDYSVEASGFLHIFHIPHWLTK